MYPGEVTIPFGTSATIYLPDAQLEGIEGITNLPAMQDGDTVEVELSSGTYSFHYTLTGLTKFCYSFDFSLFLLNAVPETKEILKKMMIMLSQIPDDLAPDQNLPF